MPRGRHFFGRGFWKRGYYGFPFPGGGGRGRDRGFYRPAIPYMAGNWAPPYVHYVHYSPPTHPSFYRRGYYPPFYSSYGGIKPVAPYLF